jgi:aldehyde:ferredoxin oxidoreductase
VPGYIGRVLRVDLSSGSIATEEPPEHFYRQYFGGEGLVGYYLLKELRPGVDALSPQNRLIFAAGPLTGAPVGGCGRHSVGGKSPLTGAFGEAEAGGYWGAELKFAGFDAVIVQGRAEKPVYLLIRDGQAGVKDARHLWGLKTLECQEAIRKEMGDPDVRVAQIGPAGERLVRFACVVHDLDAFAGRTGMGAVMGSKNLKAIACRGHQKPAQSDAQAVASIARWVRDNIPLNNRAYRDLGTASSVRSLNRRGGLPTRNFQTGSFEGAERISGEAMRDTILVRRRSCYACPIRCKREVKVEEPYRVDPRYGGPEYETIASLGSNCGLDDLKAITKGGELANAYGLDSISTGAAIAFAMECFERGFIGSRDTGGLELRFGNGPAVVEMVERIALRQGLGDFLAEGVARAAKKLGPPTEELALHVKRQEVPMHEPRLKHGLGLGYIMSPTGADHCHNMHDSNYTGESPYLEDLKALGILEPVPLTDLSPAKIRLLLYYTFLMHFMNCALMCYFVSIYGFMGLQRVSELVQAVTGWNTSVWELMKVGERALNMALAFNRREGFSQADDVLPHRFFTPQPSGPLQGVSIEENAFLDAKETYYQMMGWPEGNPSPAKLEELGIDWAVPMMEGK